MNAAAGLPGPETAKAAANFGRGQTPRAVIRAYAAVKKACLTAIQEASSGADKPAWTEAEFAALKQACDQVREGRHDGHFILPLRQGGAGTSLNMNQNEVLAAVAGELASRSFDPIADLNRYQSTNDTFSTAATIVVFEGLIALEKQVILMQETLVKKERAHALDLMTGRTEMQDALPMTLGQVYAAWAGLFERDRWRLNKLKERVRTIALGGTALGTGFAAPQTYIFAAEKALRQITGLPLCRSQNLTDEIAHLDKFSELASGCRLVAENVFKLTGDLLLYTSSAVGELVHPNLQHGSTIMAAKTNPVILEWARGLAMDVLGECQKISLYSQNGQLQLNAWLPFVVESFLRIFENLELALTGLMDKFFALVEVRTERLTVNLVQGKALFNALLPLLGYEAVKRLGELVDELQPADLPALKQLIAAEFAVDPQVLDDYLEPGRLTSSGRL